MADPEHPTLDQLVTAMLSNPWVTGEPGAQAGRSAWLTDEQIESWRAVARRASLGHGPQA